MTTTAVVPVDEQLPTAPAEDLELAAGRATAEQILTGALDTLDHLVAAHPADVEGNARVWALLTTLRADAARLLDEAARNLHAHAPRRFTVDGVATFELHTASSTAQWDHDHLWAWISAAACARLAVDPDTGEIAGPGERDLIERAVDLVIGESRAMQSPGSWRKTAIKERGIDLADVCTTTYGKPTVRTY